MCVKTKSETIKTLSLIYFQTVVQELFAVTVNDCRKEKKRKNEEKSGKKILNTFFRFIMLKISKICFAGMKIVM